MSDFLGLSFKTNEEVVTEEVEKPIEKQEEVVTETAPEVKAESSLKEEDIQTKTEDEVIEPKTKTEEPVFEEEVVVPFNERFTSKIKEDGYLSKEDFETTLNSKKEEWEKEFKSQSTIDNEYINKLIELHKKGINVDSKMAEVINRDYDSIDVNDTQTALDMVKQKMLMDGRDAEDADFLIRKKYKALFDEDYDLDSPEYKDAKSQLKIDFKDVLSERKRVKEQYLSAETNPTKTSTDKESIIEQYKQQQEQDNKVLAEQQKADLDKSLLDLYNEAAKIEKRSYDFGDGKVEFDITDDFKKSLRDEFLDLPNFMNKEFMNEDGSVKVDELVDLFVAKKHLPKLLKMVYTYGKGDGGEQLTDIIKNADVSSKDSLKNNTKPSKGNINDFFQRH